MGCYKVTVSAKQAKEYYWMVKLSAKILEVAKQYTSNELILAADGMGDLSDIMKIEVASESCMFAGNASQGIGMSYATKYTTSTSDTVNLLKALYNGTARGVCQQFAEAEVLVFGYWGIDVNYKTEHNHAWTEGTAANADGDMVDYEFDYGFEGINRANVY